MLFNQPLAFIDVETTGTDPGVHEIIELGLVLTRLKDDTLTVIDQLDLKTQPEHLETADPVALRINGYNEADWLFAAGLTDAIKTFGQKTDGAVFVAHNITFDAAFIDAAFKKTGVENKMYFQKLDTLSIAFSKLHDADDMGKLSLKALCEKFGIENKKAHTAFADAYATYELFKKLMHLH
ncbi:MAG TPA: 3'-5' exonuclease [Candidatus Paceibacterota bacterium]|nr:3'-5' exonuclease [Candidatus Paceibacterota bacterium]